MEWTEKDIARAAREGWKYRNGYVAPIFESEGNLISTFDVVKYLARKAQTSQWHRDLYMELPWTDADDYAARAHGWRLWVQSNRTAHIWSCDGTKLATSEDAETFVKQQASKENPDPLCIKAISKLTKLRLLQGT